MYWLQRPPYLRWAAAALLLISAIAWDLRSSGTAQHPFAGDDIARGTSMASAPVEWRPARGLPEPIDLDGIASVDIPRGDPITASVVEVAVPFPEDWWLVSLDVPGAGPGDEVLIVVTEPSLTIAGTVVEGQLGDRFSLDHRPATIALPQEMAPIVAAAADAGRVVTALRPG